MWRGLDQGEVDLLMMPPWNCCWKVLNKEKRTLKLRSLLGIYVCSRSPADKSGWSFLNCRQEEKRIPPAGQLVSRPGAGFTAVQSILSVRPMIPVKG